MTLRKGRPAPMRVALAEGRAKESDASLPPALCDMAFMTPRNLILILATSGFASTFSSRAVEPMVGVIARDLGTDVQTAALLSAAFALPYAFVQPILGPVGDAVGKERVMKWD